MDPNQQQVQPLVTLTRPFGNTKLPEPLWYVCTIPNASMHRQDGKKLPFVNGFLKVMFVEDRDFLDNEIEGGNIYIRNANNQEREQARMMEDPLGVIKDHMRPELREEIITEFSIEELETLLAKRKEAVGKPAKVEHPQNAALTAGPNALQTAAIPANETAVQKTLRLAAEARALATAGKLNPVSTSQVPGASSNSGV